MFTKRDILDIGRKAYDSFSKKYDVDASIKIVNSLAFWKLAKKSSLVKAKLKQGVPVMVGALVVHSSLDTIYVSKDVINSITDDPKFVKAIFLHEFYHIYFKSKMKDSGVKSSSDSEERAKSAMKKDFPNLARDLV